MGKTTLILLLCLLTRKIYGQDTCNHSPFTPIFILNNTPLEYNSLNCTSGFQGVPFWYPMYSEVLTGFLNPCTNYVIPDSTYVSGSVQSYNVCLFPTVPMPVPDGKGIIAVSDFGFNNGIYVYPSYKSYASTCLISPLQKDSLYRLDFYVGFGTPGSEFLPVTNQLLGPGDSPSPEIFGLFGFGDCSGLPKQIPIIGCPTRLNWTNLGTVKVGGLPGTWVKASIQFTPGMDIRAIAIGSSCDTNFTAQPLSSSHNGQSLRNNTFSYFLDSLQFYQAKVPPPVISLVSGNPCSSAVVLQMQPADFYIGAHFQWYRNDVALSNENGSTITIPRKNSGSDAYKCQVQNDSVCLVSDPFEVSWTPIPNAGVLGISDTTVCLNESLLLNAFTDTTASYLWQNGSTSPYFSVTQRGTYRVTISNACGSATSQKTVNFEKCNFDPFLPNAFTPNGDGKNDVFRAHYFNPPGRFDLQVFNRNGLEVFASLDPAVGWDGTFKGIRQPSGTYLWIVRYTDKSNIEHTMKGSVVLIR
jgi:gliding motility-associated-like protein